MDAMPRDVALKLCEEILRENRGKWYSFYGMWCWGAPHSTKETHLNSALAAAPTTEVALK